MNLNINIHRFKPILNLSTEIGWLNKILPQDGIKDLLENFSPLGLITNPYSNESDTRDMDRLDQ